MSIEAVTLSNHVFLCHPLLLLASVFPSIRVFSNELTPCIRWPSTGSSACRENYGLRGIKWKASFPSSILSPFMGGLVDLLRNMEKAAVGEGVTSDWFFTFSRFFYSLFNCSNLNSDKGPLSPPLTRSPILHSASTLHPIHKPDTQASHHLLLHFYQSQNCWCFGLDNSLLWGMVTSSLGRHPLNLASSPSSSF